MSWLQKLSETYDAVSGEAIHGVPLPPICHSTQQAHIEIVIDERGGFRGARVLDEAEATLVPCTEESASRSGKRPTHHPLCDKLQYIAGDFVRFGGTVTSGFSTDPSEPHRGYLEDLQAWSDSSESHPKVRAICAYVKQGRAIADLVAAGALQARNGTLLKDWADGEEPAISRVIPAGQSPDAAFVRWSVDGAGLAAETWKDSSLFESWIRYYATRKTAFGLCIVTGLEGAIAESLPSKLRHAGDRAKLISSNDTSGFTFRGRFAEAGQAATIGFYVGQKAHTALRWLIERQAFRNGDQVVVAWAVSGAGVPDPLADTLALLGVEESSIVIGTEQAFALALRRAIAGYGARLNPADDVVVMTLDSATPGRLAIVYYREIKGSEFLARVEAWHQSAAWPQNYGKDRRFVGAPAPRDIAEAAYGQKVDSKHKKAVVERLLPCIVDARPIPGDLVRSVIRRASQRSGLEPWEFEKCLGIACALFRKQHAERKYQMTLDRDRTTRDYLYGRLLALADQLESYALWIAGERGRETAAARLMQRFADRPYSTWRTIELSLLPYRARLKTNRPGPLHKLDEKFDEVMTRFSEDDFRKDSPLSGEFLLGFHCQRADLRPTQTQGKDESEESAETPNENSGN